MYRSNLSYHQLERYLGLLSDGRMIVRGESGRFRITPRGQVTLRKVASVIRSLRDLSRDLDPAVANGHSLAD